MEPLWFFLALGLAGASIGAKGLLGLTFALLAFLVGGFVMLVGVTLARNNLTIQHLLRVLSRQSWSWFRGPFANSERLKRNEADAQDRKIMWDSASLTGS